MTIMPTIYAVIILLYAVLAPPIVHGGDTPSSNANVEAYGIIDRKQDATRRVIFRPISGDFVQDADVIYYNIAAEAICKGNITSIYSDEIYTNTENCDRFDEIKAGFVIGLNANIAKIKDIYLNRTRYDAIIRERRWNRASGVPLELDDAQFDDMVRKSRLPVLVEFYVNWCPYCNGFVPIIGEIAKDLENKIRVATIDKEKNNTLAKEYGVTKYPAFFLIKGGNVVDSWTGAYKSKTPVIERVNKKIK